jgi:FlaA1/EpsC-like NDP-sugar epimerase
LRDNKQNHTTGIAFMKNLKSKVGYTPLIILLDILSVFFVFYLCVCASFSWQDVPAKIWANISIYAAVASLFILVIFSIFKVYKWLTVNFGLSESIKLGFISGISIMIAFGMMFVFPAEDVGHFRISTYFTGTITFIFLIELWRMARRLAGLYLAKRFKSKSPHKNTLIVGAGAAAKIVIDDSRNNLQSKSQILVLVDDDPRKIGRTYSGIPVEGPISSIASIVKKHKIDEVIIAIQSLNKDKLHEIISSSTRKCCEKVTMNACNFRC